MFKTDFLNLTSKDTLADREARRRAELGTHFLGGTASKNGLVVNFSANPSKPSAPSVGGTLSFYPTVEVKRADQDPRLDKLPPAVAALPKRYAGLTIEQLEAVAAVYEGSRRRSWQPTPIHRQDLAKALNTSVEKAEAVLAECERRGLIRRQAALTASVPHFVPLI